MVSTRWFARCGWWKIPLLLGACLSVAVLAVRNMYDDELLSFLWILRPVHEIWAGLNATDVHPPGMYVGGAFAYSLTGSVRWMTLLPLATWFIGLTLFVVSTRRLWTSAWGACLFALLCYLHPHTTMWMNSIRWYPWWSGLALAMIAVGLVASRSHAEEGGGRAPLRPPSFAACVLLGLLGGLMFYLNYLTILYMFWFSIAWLIRHGVSSRSWARLGVISLVSIVLSIPQILPFVTVHLANGGGQCFSMTRSALQLLHGLSVGDAILPWHPIAVVAGACFLLPSCVLFGYWLLSRKSGACSVAGTRRIVISLAVLFVGLVVTGVITGLGGKSRNFAFLVPLCALFVALGAGCVRSRSWRVSASVLAAAWIMTGATNLLARTGTVKNGLNDHPEEVVAKVSELAGNRPALVFTHDPALTVAFHDAVSRKGTELTVCSYYADPIGGVARGLPDEPIGATQAFVIRTYEGSLASRRNQLEAAVATARAALVDEAVIEMGRDRDWKLKSRVSGDTLPEYRYVIYYGEASEVACAEAGRAWTNW